MHKQGVIVFVLVIIVHPIHRSETELLVLLWEKGKSQV